ncbi:2Fe-2S iron-sulfur cluster-binding protein [Streptomyces sp. HB132]|uniref:2Fe-2S iron-sulfur cluster-binding protein n=1 Tax=Streptomyces sp. HB132 TaxID=767388 RepID=UPI0019606365|nr:2Fe-2S iron-sulfur cluster-binding protein [Streptomyces sp. HB132]MBM7442796.1 aerobic-type carbon monoxide dehydrogenase small subunit (CoxS/CutS family) [Streptomyces sp. HB132]
MSNEENPEQRQGRPDPYAGWEPTPQGGEYDAEATAFVHLAPEDLAALGNDPLAAPGHSYVPPMILPLTPAAGLDPAATGSWVVQTQSQQERASGHSAATEAAPDAVHWPDPNQHQDPYQQPYPDTSQYAQTSSTTAQWNFTEAVHAEPEPAPEPAGHTGEWTIPVTDSDLPEESGEFAAAASPWYADSPPATLPGGAPAPWATQEQAPEPQPEPEPEPQPEPEVRFEETAFDPSEPVAAPEGHGEAEAAPEAVTGAAGEPEEAPGNPPVDAPEAEADVSPGAEAEAGPEVQAEAGPEAEAEAEAEAGVEAGLGAVSGPEAGPEAGPGYEQEHAHGLVPPEEPAAPVLSGGPSEHPSAAYVLHVNGVDRPVSDAWIGESLLYVLRERLGLAGAKDGCSQGECGACNVQVDGRLVASCLVPAATTAGSEVRTVEGLAVNGEPSDVQRALAECGAVQCGFCIPGMAMTVHDLLEGNHAPSELETRQALCGNLCRCSGYRGVLDAVRDVVEGREAIAEAPPTAPDDAEPRIPHQAPPGEGGAHSPEHEGDVR